MDTAAYFFLVLFLVFSLALGAIVFAARTAEARAAEARAAEARAAKARAAEARAAKARAQNASAEKEAARNANTRFFGVDSDAVQIGNSPPASNFTLLAQPNNRGKQVKPATGAVAPTERSELYRDFWKQFLNRVGTEHPGWTKAKTSKRDSRYDLPTGTSGVVYSTAFSQQGLRVQLYFRSPDASINQGRFRALYAMKDHFEQAVGEAANWDDKPGKKAAAIYVTSQFDDVADVDLWPAMLDWVLDQHVRFRRAVEAVGGLGSLGG
jgi:Domain of unknown function (DUF4268)